MQTDSGLDMDSCRVGVIGGGQLAWMMGDAAQALGIELLVQTPQPTDPAAAIAAEVVLGAIAAADVTAKLAQHCDVITFENEFVDLPALGVLEQQGVRFYPALKSLAPLLDKYHQRQFLRDCGIPVPHFEALEGDRLTQIQASFSLPIVLKARRHGYDGQGTHILKDWNAVQAVLEQRPEVDWLVEEFVPFDRELAIMAARSVDGAIALYPVVESQQEQQVCRRVYVLPNMAPDVIRQSEAIARTILERLDAVGIIGVELFLTAEGQVLVNEIAPRTHNSGHYTLDACVTSQFEQQLRAVCQIPLGSTDLTCDGAVMVNLLGFESSQQDYRETRDRLSQLPDTRVYWYGKAQSRPGRKLGHVTTRLHQQPGADVRTQAEAIAHTIETIWYPSKS